MAKELSKKETSGELIDKQMTVLKANTELSEPEIQKFYSDFKNECPSGTMNKEQFYKFYKRILVSKEKDLSFVDNMFAVFDQNHDGSIAFSEFVLTLAMLKKRDLNGTLNFGFEMMDISGDGYISYDEMVDFLEKILRLTDPEDKKDMNSKLLTIGIFNMFNLNKRQNISKKQFIDGCKNNQSIAEIFGFS
ncbi:unnamed protein product [Rotaria sordida]|uniref:EF-hand domain-containing protein n=1 Tax=Rotaria sordida TaxID=392033 RepID=A0A814B2N2_9BILA|nr:unnamed protein product [Rotaria sordida]